MICEIHRYFIPCRRTATVHTKIRMRIGEVYVFICSTCREHIDAVEGRLLDGVMAAAHPVDVPCRHPHGEWHDDGCVLPVTAETVEDVRTAEEVPA